MKTESHHHLIEVSGILFDVLDDLELIRQNLLRCISEGGGTVLGNKFHKFEPYGLSGIILLSESHVSIHTWPEEGYAALDVFTCGDWNIGNDITHNIIKWFNPKTSDVKYIKRGI